jgi:hypothetical protein
LGFHIKIPHPPLISIVDFPYQGRCGELRQNLSLTEKPP